MSDQATLEAPERARADGTREGKGASRGTILIVDDERGVRHLLRETLEGEGHHCREVASAEDAIFTFGSEPFDLVLSDLRLPGMDGFQLLRHVRMRGEDTGVLLITAFDDTATAIRALREGALDYIVKPFDLAEVRERTRAALERVRELAEKRRQELHLRDEVKRYAEALRQAQEELRRSERGYRRLFDEAAFPMLLLDRSRGEVLEANRRAEALLGYGPREMAYLDLEALDPEGALRESLGGPPAEWRGEREVRLRSREGETLALPGRWTHLPGEWGDMALLSLEPAAREEPESPGLLATLSHEMRTPLASILGHAEILDLLVGGLGGQGQQSVGHIRRNAQALLYLVESVLEAERRGGKPVLPGRSTEPAELVRDVIGSLQPLAEGQGIRLEGTIVGAPPTLAADEGTVRQILMNLATNAIRATREGGVRIKVVAPNGDRSHVEFRVVDTGCGMVAGHGGEEPLEERPEGRYGLGLKITRKLAASLGGEVSLRSRPGFGTVMRVRIPVESAPARPGAAAAPPPPPRPSVRAQPGAPPPGQRTGSGTTYDDDTAPPGTAEPADERTGTRRAS
jgi:signal transduction histidine kinase/FixJ family two-component response regulator